MDLLKRVQGVFIMQEGDSSKGKWNKKLIILLVVGIGLLILSSLFSAPAEEKEPPSAEKVAEEVFVPGLEKKGDPMEVELENMLNCIKGIDNASVFLTKESGVEQELAKTSEGTRQEVSEEDGEGGTREVVEKNWVDDYVLKRDSQGGEEPLVLVEHEESYRGVLVVARGVENPQLKSWVTKALSSLLGLPSHRVTVLPRGD